VTGTARGPWGRLVGARQRVRGRAVARTGTACHAMLGQWKEAVDLYSLSQHRVRYVELALVSSGPAGYRSACEKMVKQLGATKIAAEANSVAWACVLGPDALPDMTPAVELARLAVKDLPTYADARRTLGAVLYRAGKHDEAVTELT